MDNNTQNNRIDDFILNRLNSEDRSDFQVQLEKDSTLQEELHIRTAMVDQIKTIGDLKLKDRILAIQSTVETKETNETKVGIRRFLQPIFAAAAILLLLVIAYQWMNTSTTFSNQDLVAQNYQSYEIPFGDRSSSTDNSINNAGALYQQNKYKEAIPLFEKLIDAGQGDDRITLALGISHLELKEYEKAITILKQASAQSEFLYQDQAQWYTALAYLQLDQVEESKAFLQLVKDNPNAFFKEKAKELLSNLK